MDEYQRVAEIVSEEKAILLEEMQAARAADFLETYADFINVEKPANLELHPYLPELEDVAASMRAAILSKRSNVHSKTPRTDALVRRGGDVEAEKLRRDYSELREAHDKQVRENAILCEALAKCAALASANLSDQQREITDAIQAVALAKHKG